MSALGQKQTSRHVRLMSALPPKSGHQRVHRLSAVGSRRPPRVSDVMAPSAHPQRGHSVFDQDQCANLRRVVEVMSRASDDGGLGVSSNLGHPVWWPFFFPLLLVFERRDDTSRSWTIHV
jgi:hypothetical protein